MGCLRRNPVQKKKLRTENLWAKQPPQTLNKIRRIKKMSNRLFDNVNVTAVQQPGFRPKTRLSYPPRITTENKIRTN